MDNKSEVGSPFTKRLKTARVDAGLSQKQLGIKAGFDEFGSSARMNQYERGKHTPDYQAVKQICSALNVPVAYMFTEEDDLAKLIKLYAGLSDTDKKKTLELLDNIAPNT